MNVRIPSFEKISRCFKSSTSSTLLISRLLFKLNIESLKSTFKKSISLINLLIII